MPPATKSKRDVTVPKEKRMIRVFYQNGDDEEYLGDFEEEDSSDDEAEFPLYKPSHNTTKSKLIRKRLN